MGQNQSGQRKNSFTASTTTSPGNEGNMKLNEEQEYLQLGTVQVNITWLNGTNRPLSEQQQPSELQVTAKGALFHGNTTPSQDIINSLSLVHLHPRCVALLDSRTHHFLISHVQNGWYAFSSPEFFSRHSGTCIIIGDRTNPGKPYPLKIGDCFRLGSVGVVVSEIKNDRGVEQRLESNRLQYLREEALAFDGEDEAALAAEEEDLDKRKDENTFHGDGGNGTGTFFCYMCYETHDTPDDHLVAPCECKGDTRYLHVQCLQKWYQSSICGSKALVIRTTGNGAPACKICGAAYKTVFRNNGVKTSLLELDHPGPYISLVVVTRHDTSPGLFNTKFRLNFGPGYRVGIPHQLQDDPELTPSELSIGRSSLCNMVLDYRTVSTVHAKLTYRNGQFFIQDSRSSNGTMVYLQGPLALPNNEVLRLRMGRSTLAIKAKRSIAASVRGALHRLPTSTPCTASLSQLQEIMALAPAQKSSRQADKAEAQPEAEEQKVSPPPQRVVENGDQQSQSSHVEAIDNAIILGPERRDGGSGRENLDSSGNSRSNGWNEPVPLTLSRNRGSSNGNLASTTHPANTSPREVSQSIDSAPAELKIDEEPKKFLHPHADDVSVSNESGGGDSLSMVAVHQSSNPLSAISSKPSHITPTGEEESLDEQSDQAVASIQNLSRAIVVEIMSNVQSMTSSTT